MRLQSSFIIISILSVMTSCVDANTELSIDEEKVGYEFTEVSEAALQHIQHFSNSASIARLSDESIKFNYEEVRAIRDINSNISINVVNGLSEANNGVNYAIGFYETGQGIGGTLICKAVEKELGITHVEYYTKEGTKLMAFEVNSEDKSTTLLFTKVGNAYGRTECDGQEVIDCVTDAYEENGWWSVGLFAATLVAPEIGLIVVGVCGLQEC